MPRFIGQTYHDFMVKLSKRQGISARMLEFLILTCSRSNEARGARWCEIDGDVWTVPAERMKARAEHRVPLAPQVFKIIVQVAGLDDDLLFPSRKRSRSGAGLKTSDQVFAALMRRMGVVGITTHGFRSTFRDWCRDNEIADRELAEMTLAHRVGNSVERAYARSDLIGRRFRLMEQWADFALSGIQPASTKKRARKRIKRHEKGPLAVDR